MKLPDALRKAQSLGLDLVEVAPTANPPVCKVVALGKFRYDISKQEKDKRATGAKLKEIKFGCSSNFADGKWRTRSLACSLWRKYATTSRAWRKWKRHRKSPAET